MKIALFGGTFDPIHNAHLAVARAAADRFGLDRVLFVPAAHPPHKDGVTTAPYADRMRMTELACKCDPRFEASRLEEGTPRSYSIDTIEKVRSALAPNDELFFIIGADAFAEIQTWRRWRDVVRSVCFIVASRPGHTYIVPEGVKIKRLDGLDLSASSSAIRQALETGNSSLDIPDCILTYIAAKNLYRGGNAQPVCPTATDVKQPHLTTSPPLSS